MYAQALAHNLYLHLCLLATSCYYVFGIHIITWAIERKGNQTASSHTNITYILYYLQDKHCTENHSFIASSHVYKRMEAWEERVLRKKMTESSWFWIESQETLQKLTEVLNISVVSESKLSNPSPSPSHHLQVRVKKKKFKSESRVQ